MEVDYGDLPISRPEQDVFGIDGFVQSLAQSIENMRSPNGVVIALNGPWGSGKSSAMNLLKHHLAPAIEAKKINIVDFNAWWFRGEEALVLAFFRELYAATKPNIGERAKKLLPKLGARLLNAGGAVAPIADVAGAPGAGAVASGVMGWLSGMIEDDESVEKLHRELSDALEEQSQRFVILIDDIDRLVPDEALAIFRMVKSVGRLPNVIYVLSFDRELAERIVSERFPSEGPHYLEKIVQAAFELPAPLEDDIHRILKLQIDSLAGGIQRDKLLRVMNLFHSAVAPEIKTPRDAARYINALTITWPAVEGEVDLGDFIAIEALRIFQPSIYRAIRDNQSIVCRSKHEGFGQAGAAERLDSTLLAKVEDKTRYRSVLIRLFPSLDAIWGNTIRDDSGFDKDRRIASKKHFHSYFRMSIDPDIVSRKDLSEFIRHASDPIFVSKTLKDALSRKQRDGSTRTKAWLDALIAHAEEFQVESVGQLLSGIFSVADDINVVCDREGGFSIGDNALRIHWLLRSLLFDRTTLRERSAILITAMRSAQLAWLANITISAWENYNPPQGKDVQDESKCLLTPEDVIIARDLFLDRMNRSSQNGTLIDTPDLFRTIYIWAKLAPSNNEINEWMSKEIDKRDSLVKIAQGLTSQSWSQSIDDLVAIRSDVAVVSGIGDFIEPALLRARIEALHEQLEKGSADFEIVDRFLNAWKLQERREEW